MNQPIREPYIIKSDKVEERYARGWHVIGHHSDFTETPVTLDYFNQRLVAYRGKDDGRVRTP